MDVIKEVILSVKCQVQTTDVKKAKFRVSFWKVFAIAYSSLHMATRKKVD